LTQEVLKKKQNANAITPQKLLL